MNINNKISKLGAIYRIINTVNGKFYIGSTKNAAKRASEHFRALNKGCHANDYLQNAYDIIKNKEMFNFEVIIYCKEEQLVLFETRCIEQMNPDYNLQRVVNERFTPSEATRQKLSLATKGKRKPPPSKETLAKMSAANIGKVLSEDTKLKISIASKNRKVSPETRAKMSAARKGVPSKRKGQHLSDEHREKIGKANKGKIRSEDHFFKMSEIRKGKPAHNKGKPQSPEANAKQKETWRRKKELAALRKSGNTQPLATVENKIL
jgi:group I intron endonuclease